MRKLATLLAVAAIGFAGCGSEGKGGGEAKPTPDKAGEIGKKPGESARVKEASADTGKAVYSGEATAASDGGAASGMDLSIEIARDGSVAGELSIKGAKHKVTGVLDGETLRCWVAGGLDDPKTARRGTLVGKMGAGRAEGTFAISNDGASEVISGTWKVSSPGK